MAYLGKTPSQAVRSRYYFTASGGETSLAPAQVTGLSFTDANYVDVSLNGVALVSGTDYTATPSTNTISSLAALTASDVVEIVVYDTFSVFGGSVNGDFNISGGDLTLGDNDKAIFGAGSDLQIYHTGGASYIQDNGSGNLVIDTNGAGTYLMHGSEIMASFVADGAVGLRHDNSEKLATTSTGIDVTGTVTADGLTVDGTATITTTGNETQLTLTSTDADATTGPNMSFFRNSSSAADGDQTGSIFFIGKDDAGNDTTYGGITTHIVDASNTTEDGRLTISSIKAGTSTGTLHVVSGSVGIGTSSPLYNLDVGSGSGSNSINIFSGSTDTSAVYFTDNTTGVGSYIGRLGYNHTADAMIFTTNATEAMRIDSSGRVMIGTTTEGFADYADTLTVADTNHAGITIRSGASSSGSLYFSDATSGSGEYDGYLNYSHSAQKLTVGTAAATRMTITSAGRVGIGTSAPTELLHLNANNPEFTMQAATDGGECAIYFKDDDGNKDGRITYRTDYSGQTDNFMSFFTNNSEKVRIDSSGNLLVGTTDTTPYNNSANSTADNGIALGGTGILSVAKFNDSPLIVNRTGTNDGEVIKIHKSGSEVGSIGVFSTNNLYVGSSTSGHSALQFGSSQINPMQPAGTVADNVVDLGNPTERFDDIYATNGTIQTSDQQEKNTITDSDLGLDFINRLEPKSYVFNGKTRTHYGLIAQDVETVLGDINKPTSGFAGFIKSDISEEEDGSEYRYGLRYTEFVGPLIQAVKDLKAENDAMRARLTALENAE